METRVNQAPTDTAGRQRAYEDYMATFSPRVVIHGLVPSGDVDYAGLRRFYAALFGTFRDSVLVSDELIVAGNMAAQRYHAWGRMSGEFDGVRLEDRLVALRGQTFFRLDEDGRIAERWSNHDHGYRMALTRGPEGAEEGRRLARFLNGPGLAEEEVYARLDAFADAFNLIQAPEQRIARLYALFSPDVRVHAAFAADGGLEDLRAHYQRLWGAYPDLVMQFEAKLSTWSMGAVRWRATGSRRQPYDAQPGDWQPVSKSGEMILRYSGAGAIAEIWLNDAPAVPLEPTPGRQH
jgi:predicted ester cyclase